jgi:glycosyltransferase involved in cell wall biosynthesis
MDKILIAGIFTNEKNCNSVYRSSADTMATIFENNEIPVIRTSYKISSLSRIVDSLKTIFKRRKEYTIATVPLFGGWGSLLWCYFLIVGLKLNRKKIVLVLHGGSLGSKTKKYRLLYAWMLSSVDVVVSPSLFLKTEIEKQFDLSIQVIENIINTERYIYKPHETVTPIIFWMRTLEDIYNPEMALRVLFQLRKKYTNAKLIMAGRDNGRLHLLQKLAKELHISNAVDFVGYIDDNQKNYYAANSGVYICTNKIDNAPVSIIEMMAMGLPVVSVNSGGIPYLITNRVNGFLVNDDDDVAMSNVIEELIENNNLVKQIVHNAYQYSRQYTDTIVLKKWTNLFSRLNNKKNEKN